MGIPTVMGVIDLPYRKLDGRPLIVDGYNGTVLTSPSEATLARYGEVLKEEEQFVRGLEALIDLPCITPDHHRVSLWVNTGLMTDVVRSLDHGAEGIGLFRTEVPFLLSERFPSEQEQAEIYREQLQAFAPKPVTMRTLDIGGDKSLPYFPIEEANPFLGWRGIRVTLDHPEIFIAQTRAMIRASEGFDNLQIMLPMVSNLQEVTRATQIIKRALRELQEEGLDVKMPPIGVMIELPAAVYLTRALCQIVDFVSVGSTDLTQYLLAVDRNNPRVADLYSAFHPAVLSALQHVVTAAHAENRPVSICGELAGDPGGALLLMAMGYDSLSMNAASLPKVKSVIRSVSCEWSVQLLEDVLLLDSPHVIKSCVDLALRNGGFGRYLRPSKSASVIRGEAAARDTSG
jgi:phosphotransferase system enzyme I (PtsP)